MDNQINETTEPRKKRIAYKIIQCHTCSRTFTANKKLEGDKCPYCNYNCINPLQAEFDKQKTEIKNYKETIGNLAAFLEYLKQKEFEPKEEEEISFKNICDIYGNDCEVLFKKLYKKFIGEKIDEDETHCCECGDFTLELNHGFCIDCNNRREYLSEMERVVPGEPRYNL